MKRLKSFCLSLLLAGTLNSHAQEAPKREFRGAWLHTVYQGQYASMNKGELQNYLKDLLDRLQEAGINAVIFQVRPSADAFYPSKLEPWSRFLTGRQGKAPVPVWDPTEFLIEECHQRNMEFHAWLNPYRVTTSKNEFITFNHIYNRNPEWFLEYGDKLYFDPGLPQCRKFIRQVVKDIVGRYDIDAIHMDDYFYPYPISGQEFPDEDSFAQYRTKMGFSADQRGDWRRQNVNILIKSLHEDIKSLKPWVRFGISPFGIYRNESSDPDGSKTRGLQNYDDLYADVTRWTNEGWVDYMLPQLYWEIGHKAADYTTLIEWWNKHSNDRHMYIGQSIDRSLDDSKDLTEADSHLEKKMELSRSLSEIDGNCFWYGYQIGNNDHKIATALKRKYHVQPALIPAYSHIDSEAPKKVKGVKAKWSERGYELSWKRHETKDEMQKQVYYCIYRFENGEKIDLEKSSNLVATTRETNYLLPYEDGQSKYKYVVTSVDRMHNESKKSRSKSVKL